MNMIRNCFAAAAFLLPAAAFAAPDGDFLKDAYQGDATEVAMGMMAQHHGSSPAIRAYGRMLARDHGAHKMKVAMLARSMGVHPEPGLSPDGMQAKSMMMAMHGAQFDAAFKRDMIDDHNKDIAKYEAEARGAQSPRVRHLAEMTLPTLHKHLVTAQAL